MSIEPLDLAEQKDKRKDRLNNAVALTIALLATFMGICKLKDENIVQAMEQAQVDRNDTWAWFQARNVRKEVLDTAADEMRALNGTLPPGPQPALSALAEKFSAASTDQVAKMGELKEKAEGFVTAYDQLNFHDDQFDLMEAGLSIAISVLAIAALTDSFGLYYAALVPAAFGVIMGLAGLFSWQLHPDTIAKWLGT